MRAFVGMVSASQVASRLFSPPYAGMCVPPMMCFCVPCTWWGPGRKCSSIWVAGPARSSVLLGSWCWKVHSEVAEGAAPDFEGVSGCSFYSHGCCLWPNAGGQTTPTRVTSL